MKKIKGLVFVLVVLLCLALCGCELLHEHDYQMQFDDTQHYLKCKCGEIKETTEHSYKWVDGENPETARLECAGCCHILDLESIYTAPLLITPYTYSGINYGGRSTPSVGPMIEYEIKVDSAKHNYNEEFDIILTLEMWNAYLFNDGPFHVKLMESPYYEIIGQDERIISDFGKDKRKETPVVDFKFTIKPTNPCNLPNNVEFKIKFEANQSELKREASGYMGSIRWYYDLDDEYFFTINHLTFINDSEGMLLAQNANRAFYLSLNREYLSGTIDKDKYIDRLVEYIFNDTPYVDRSYETFTYISKNVRAKLTLGIENGYLLDRYHSLTDENFTEGFTEIIKEALKILLDNNLLSYEEYINELNYISEKGICRRGIDVWYDNIPFADYVKNNYVEIHYIENGKSNAPSSTEGNSASLYLPKDRTSVGEQIDLEIYTSFSKEIKGYIIETQDGFSLSSDIIFNNNIIKLSLSHNQNAQNPHYGMKIVLDGDEEITFFLDLYGYVNNGTLYLSQWSFNEAYNVYMSYENPDESYTLDELEKHRQIDCFSISTSVSEATTLSSNESNYDTVISGQFYWQDDFEQNHPLQYCMVQLWDREPTGEVHLQTTYTDEHGRYRFEINNDLSEDEGGYDFSIKILSCGEYVSVCNDEREVYIKTIYLVDNISSGEHNNNSATFSMTESDVNTELFGQALQIAEAAIFASKYYYDMNGTTNGNVILIYPYNEQNGDCYYAGNGEIRIVGDLENTNSNLKSYACWDVIMHEYGHYVEDKENITNDFWGWHGIDVSMAEHYYSHVTDDVTPDCKGNCAFAGGNINEDQCKLAGISIAWSEGWATYFSMVAQEYSIEHWNLGSIDTVGDGAYSSYLWGNPYSVESPYTTAEDCESAVQAILYDIYDSSTDFEKDGIELGHKALWDIVMDNEPKTFDEFDDYFEAIYNDLEVLEKYGKLLSLHNLALGDRTENGIVIPGVVTGELTMNCPRFECLGAYNNSLYLDDRTFVLNFYDEDKTLIGRTAEQAERVFTIDSVLWQSVLDSGKRFYVSATIIENHEPKTDYEGQWYEFSISIPPVVIDTNYTETLESGECYWYVFTVPQTGEYVFSTSGNTDTVGEILEKPVVGQSIDGLTDYNDNSGEDNNFSITKYLDVGQKVYIRISGANWTATGEYTFTVKRVDHEHIYTHRYVSNGDTNHKAYCACGEYVTKKHVWHAGITNNYCQDCGFITTGGLVVKPDFILDDDVLYYH